MKNLKRRPRGTKNTKGSTIMMTKVKVIVPAILVVCAVVIGTLIVMGPKQSLQTPPIEKKAMAYIQKHNFLTKDEKLTGYKAISYYNYDKAAVITDKRIFIYNKDQVFSIPLNKITAVVVKDSELGQQQVLITAQSSGMINIDLYHSSVEKLIQLLGVPNTNVKHAGKELAEQFSGKPHSGKF